MTAQGFNWHGETGRNFFVGGKSDPAAEKRFQPVEKAFFRRVTKFTSHPLQCTRHQRSGPPLLVLLLLVQWDDRRFAHGQRLDSFDFFFQKHESTITTALERAL